MSDRVSWNDLNPATVHRRGVILLGGPLEGDREVLLIASAASEDAVRQRFAPDPWLQDGTLSIVGIERWTILLDGLGQFSSGRR